MLNCKSKCKFVRVNAITKHENFVFFLDADRKPVAEAVTALIKGKSQKN